jgi:hypothetical protein
MENQISVGNTIKKEDKKVEGKGESSNGSFRRLSANISSTVQQELNGVGIKLVQDGLIRKETSLSKQ